MNPIVEFAKTRNNYIDLDNTLRNGSNKNSKVYKHAEKLIKLFNAKILTNNCEYLPKTLLEQVNLNADIITPINILQQNLNKSFIVGTNEIKIYLNHYITNDPDDYDELIICGHIFSETTQNIAVILHLLSRLSKIYVYENYKYGPLSDITEHTLKYDIKVPYIGCLLKCFNYTGDIIEFGKITYKDPNFGIMIGDSEETDGKCCEKNNGLFIHILSDESPLRYMTNHYTVGNIDILYDSIINLIESNK
jgi:hypothetical protein